MHIYQLNSHQFPAGAMGFSSQRKTTNVALEGTTPLRQVQPIGAQFIALKSSPMKSGNFRLNALQEGTNGFQGRYDGIKNLDSDLTGDNQYTLNSHQQPSNVEELISDNLEAKLSSNNDYLEVGNPKSAVKSPAELKNNLLPWHLLFDRFGAKSNKFSINKSGDVPKNWAYEIKNPGQLGPYSVDNYFVNIKSTTTNRSINAQVFAPAKAQKNSSSPIVLVSPPSFVGELKLPMGKEFYDMQVYTSYMDHLASMGFIAIGLFEHQGMIFQNPKEINHERDVLEIKSFTDHLLGEDSPLEHKFNPQEIAVMGHSRGAKLAFYHAAIDPRVAVVLAIDPVNMGGPPHFISKKWSANPVAPIPGVVSKEDSLMAKIKTKCAIFRAPTDTINFDKRCNAHHFWDAYQGEDGVYVNVQASHADWLFDAELKELTRGIFVSQLMKHFNAENPLAHELETDTIFNRSPRLVKGVDHKANPDAQATIEQAVKDSNLGV